MEDKYRITIVIGTRPEALKLVPVILKFRQCKDLVLRIILTGQHIQMVAQVLKIFKLKEDLNLEIMKHLQTLTYLTTSVINGLEEEFCRDKPELVIVQGDTTSAFAASLAAFYQKIPVAHIEAGLRTNKIYSPYPEEMNRKFISQIASLHFAPTQIAMNNLLSSGIKENVFLTGNTIIDTLVVADRLNFKKPFKGANFENKKVILMTLHRRENWGKEFNKIANGIKLILDKHKDIVIFFASHLNNVSSSVISNLIGENPNLIISEPLDYLSMIESIKKCFLILTDSGGLQEEAPYFDKPILVLRNDTERPEGINTGSAKLIGTKSKDIFYEVTNLLNSDTDYKNMSKAKNPYGDGFASEKILEKCINWLKDTNKDK